MKTDRRMSRFSMIGKQSSALMSGGAGSEAIVNLNGFFEAATTYLQLADKDSLLKIEANLQLISVGIISYTDEEECFKYFNTLLQLIDSDLPIGILYKVLKVASDDDEGLAQLRKNITVLQRLCHNVLKVGDISEFQEWPVKKVEETILLLKILENITSGFQFGIFDISLIKLLEHLSCLFMSLCDEENKKEIPCHALAIMVNVCRAHQSSLSISEFQAMKGKRFIAKLLTFTTQQAFDESTAGVEDCKDKTEAPAYSPLLVIHLLLMLEGVAGPLPDTCLYQRMTWSFKALVEAIRKKNSAITQQASEFLTDLLSMKQRSKFVQMVTDYNSKFEDVVDALLETGHINPSCDITIIKLLSALLPLLPNNQSETKLASQLRNVLVLCNTYLVEFSNLLLDEVEIGVVQVELTTEVMTIASSVMSNIHACDDFREDFAELLQCPANVIKASVTDVEIDLEAEDLKCFIASIKLLTVICKFQDFSSSVMEMLPEETIDNLNKAFWNTPQGKLSCSVIAYLIMLNSNVDWDENFNSLVTAQSICDHVAFVIKCGSSSDILKAINIVSKMNQNSILMLKEALKELDATNCDVIPSKTIAMFSERDSAVLDNTLKNLHLNNDTLHSLCSSESPGSSMIGLVEAIHLQNIDLRAQLAQLQNCLESTNVLATQRQLLLNKAHNERDQIYAHMLQAEKRCHSKDVLLHSVQKRLKTSEASNLKIKQDFDKMLENNKQEQNKVKELTEELAKKDAALKVAETEQAAADNCIQQLETDKTNLEEKLVRYKKDCTAFNHKNGTLMKECESLKADNKAMTKKMEEMGRELLELKRVQEMVAKLTTGGKF